jgi:hypothetical protein
MTSTIAVAAPPTITSLYPAGVQRGTTRTLAVRGSLKTRPLSAWCSRGDFTLALADDKDELTVTVPAESAPGAVWIRLSNAEGASDLYPLLVGLLPEMAEAEPNNRRQEATRIERLPVTVDGSLHKAAEVDLFSVSLTAGQQLVAAIESREPLGTPADMVLQIVSAEGYVREQNDDYAGFDPLATYTARADGTVLIRVLSFPASPDSSIRFAGGEDYVYRLTLTAGPFCSHVVGPVDPAAATAAQPVGWNLPLNPGDLNTVPGIHWNRPERRLAGAPEPMSAAPRTLSEAPETDWSRPIVGKIAQPGEVDHFKLTAQKAKKVYLTIEAHSVGSRLDPVLQIIDAEGKLHKESDDDSREDRDISTNWEPSADRDYWVTVRDRFGHGGSDYVYRLAAAERTPSVELTVEADRFVLGRKEPLELPVKINRIAGYKEPLKVAVEGLPEGVTCAAVASESEGDSAKQVKLKLEVGENPGWNGPIRILARRGDETAAVATAGTRVPQTRSDQIWLTVAPLP